MDSITTVMNTIQASLKSFESSPIIPLIASGGLTVWVITNLKVIFATIKRFVVSLISFNLFNSYEDNYYTRNIQLFFNEIVSASRQEMKAIIDRINKRGYIEAIDVIQAWNLNFSLGSNVKYVLRCGEKDDEVTELKKAMKYLEFEIEQREANKNG